MTLVFPWFSARLKVDYEPNKTMSKCEYVVWSKNVDLQNHLCLKVSFTHLKITTKPISTFDIAICVSSTYCYVYSYMI